MVGVFGAKMISLKSHESNCWMFNFIDKYYQVTHISQIVVTVGACIVKYHLVSFALDITPTFEKLFAPLHQFFQVVANIITSPYVGLNSLI